MTELILISDCGRSEHNELMKSVREGGTKIMAVIRDSHVFALPSHVEDYKPRNEDWHYKGVYSSPIWRDVFAPFRSGKYGNGDNGITEDFDQDNSYLDANNAQLLNSGPLQDWIKENGLLINNGAYELCPDLTEAIAIGALGMNFSV